MTARNEAVAACATIRVVSPHESGSAEAGWRTVVYVGTALAAVAWTLLVGKDLNWDALNYHLYAGFSAVEDRFGHDFFPSGAASYFNPYAQVPFFLMVRAGLPAVSIGLALAVVHSLNLWLTYELALELNRTQTDLRRRLLGVLAVALAALNPVFLQEVGSTFTDISTAVLVLGAWLALALAYRHGGRLLIVFAGCLLGVAAALKLSNAIFAIASVPLVYMRPGSKKSRWETIALFVTGGGVAFLAAAGPWAWKLWQAFGNPVFPLFNAAFSSPDFITEPLKHDRFLPTSWQAALLRPFEMAVPDRMIHTEPRAADVRYAVLFLGLAASAIVASLAGPPRLRGPAPPSPNAAEVSARRCFVAMSLAFVTAWILWLAVSANSRYFLPMGCVAAVLIASLLPRLLKSPRVLVYSALIILGLQTMQVALGSQLRWNSQDWRGQWFRVAIPDRFKQEPNLYLSLNVQSSSFLAPFLSPGSGFVNVSGSYILAPGKPGGERAQRMIDANAGRVRMLMPIQKVDSDFQPIPPSFQTLDGRVRRFGLRTDPLDCEYFRLDGGLDLVVYSEAGRGPSERSKVTSFLTCRLVRADVSPDGYREEERRADRVFDNVEDACPNLFHPRRTASEHNGSWYRHYVLGSDLQVWIFNGSVKYSNPVVGGEPILIGRASDWERAPQTMDCSRRHGAIFEAATQAPR